MFASGSNRPKLELLPGEYMRRNMAITTSGMNWDKALAFCIEAVGIDNIMWAIDYPYQPMPGAVEFMDRAPLSDEDRTKIYSGNAERIFNIAPLADELQAARV
jgi:predicted TIM-barrel fold metal-dependent hydrolase